jgi:MauM/NapG family ferredoxin protein
MSETSRRFSTLKRAGTLWRWGRIAAQVLFFILLLGVFINTTRDGLDPNTANLPLRISPLTAIANFIASRTFLVAGLTGLILIGIALLTGRAWCGWLCPLGSILDIFPFKKLNKKKPKFSERWRTVKFIGMIGILVAAGFGNLTMLVLDPVTIWYRSFTMALWPGLDSLVTAGESALFKVPWLQNFVGTIDSLLRPVLLPFHSKVATAGWLFLGGLLIIIGLNVLAERFWCRYLCPLGGLMGLLAKIGLVKRQVLPSCTNCNACARVCPTGTVDKSKGYRSDPAECTLCMNCYKACPSEAITFLFKAMPAGWENYDPTRRQVLIGLGTGAVLGGVALTTQRTRKPGEFQLRPPGAIEASLMSRCIRCGACVRVCPTSALQPAMLQAGWDGFATPILIPRTGGCDYGCNSCGQTCPVQAIPPLALDQKHLAVIGKAEIEHTRCLPWGQGIPCSVCEEMCPLPRKAIHFAGQEEINGTVPNPDVQLPVVEQGLCIGCGICESKCPVVGEAAIRVRHL